MKPYYDQDGITIFHGDCREILQTLDPVDLVLTDPPYGVRYETARRSRTDKLRKPIANDEDLQAFADAWPWCQALLKPDRHWYVFASPRMIHEVLRVTGNAKHTIAWDKGDRGTVGDLECGFGEAWEAILYGMKGRRPLNGKRPRTVIRFDWSGTMDPVHPTVKPVPLLSKLVCWSTDEGETVLDPFMGSGTTLAAARKEGRRAIGIELEEEYCEKAVNRLLQKTLF
jgi:site-specific DNA-methyltransferase (adenine-specific)